jgi:hypothetical protein
MLLVAPACSNNSPTSTPCQTNADCSASATCTAGKCVLPGGGSSGGTDGGADGGVSRGPLSLAISGDPEGLWWEPSNSTLYIADQQNGRIMTWTDDGGFAIGATLPGPTANNDLGGLVRLADGTIVTVEFGSGTAGAVVYVSPDGGTGTVPGLDVTKRRLGLTLAADGTLYDSYFYKLSGGLTGYVAQLDINAATETDLVTTSLQKPVGVVAIGTTLYISDQDEDEVFQAPIANPSAIAVLATDLTPDLLSAGPSGTLFSGSPTGVEYQINASTGTYTTLLTAGGTLAPRGSAYDAVNQRLFVGEHDSADIANYIEIYPVSP